MVFSLSAERELERKPFTGIKNATDSVALINLCIEHTRKIADASGLDVLWFNEHLQHGATFSERYTNAVQECFDAGYSQLISIGNDSPDLTVGAIRSAVISLESKDLVIGPAEDGGVYLLGITKSAFDVRSFSELPWQQESLFQAISDQAQINGQTVQLIEELIDLDDFETVVAFAKRRPESVIGSFVLSLLVASVSETPACFHAFFVPGVDQSVHVLRGPPASSI